MFRPIKNDHTQESVLRNNISLKADPNMNDVFLPIKAEPSEIADVQFVQSCVPNLQQYISNIRRKKTDLLNLPFFIAFQEL